ncbi:2-C-methyl-D-erythritol 4-phosphate cytidylyltransferase [bacterium]|nr:2-C-methyl-D-erythritol 4-phosphate cytidylyltransferase [bacterium]
MECLEIPIPTQDSLSAIIVAGGSGNRMQSSIPKQFLPLQGKPIVQWSLECFDNLQIVDRLVLVLPKDWINEGKTRLSGFNPQKPFDIVSGGLRRQDSVLFGLEALNEENKWVAIHDGARPGILPSLVETAFLSARKNGNAVLAIPCPDTVVEETDQTISQYLNRSRVFLIQTPQIFPSRLLIEAIHFANNAQVEGTDDSGLVSGLGVKIHLTKGSMQNLKITTPDDLKMVELFFPKSGL